MATGKKKADTTKASRAKSTPKKADGPKKINVYQQYMKRELKIIKAKNPSLSHKEAFTLVAKNWKNAAENPNKGK